MPSFSTINGLFVIFVMLIDTMCKFVNLFSRVSYKILTVYIYITKVLGLSSSKVKH